MIPASSGSSPVYSKLRPLRGSRARFTLPPSITLKPDRRASLPIIAAPSNASCGFQVAAVAIPAGSDVRSRASLPGCEATPMPASVNHCGVIPRRSMPLMKPADWGRAPAGAFWPLNSVPK
jgi:hypothetical protein